MEFQLSYFKSYKMMLWKYCTQYASKLGKRSSGHKTGKGQFSFQSQKKAMPKNAQITTQLHSSHMLAASLVAQMVKQLPAMWETWVWSLGWKEPLEKGKATLSSILAWRNPWTEETGRLQSMGLQRVGHNWLTFPSYTSMYVVLEAVIHHLNFRTS